MTTKELKSILDRAMKTVPGGWSQYLCSDVIKALDFSIQEIERLQAENIVIGSWDFAQNIRKKLKESK